MRIFVALALFPLLALPALACEHDHAHHPAQPVATDPASQAFAAANQKMHREMAITFTGDADADFVRGMVPHHQGAVAMAQIVLEHGKDPVIRQLATEIIAAQEKEIALMQDWQRARPAVD